MADVRSSTVGRDESRPYISGGVQIGRGKPRPYGQAEGSSYLRGFSIWVGRMARRARASNKLLADHVSVIVDLHAGDATARYWTCDFTAEYVHINGSYRT